MLILEEKCKKNRMNRKQNPSKKHMHNHRQNPSKKHIIIRKIISKLVNNKS